MGGQIPGVPAWPRVGARAQQCTQGTQTQGEAERKNWQDGQQAPCGLALSKQGLARMGVLSRAVQARFWGDLLLSQGEEVFIIQRDSQPARGSVAWSCHPQGHGRCAASRHCGLALGLEEEAEGGGIHATLLHPDLFS